MKYLKKFENLNLFKKITRTEYQDATGRFGYIQADQKFIDDNYEDFGSGQIKELESTLDYVDGLNISTGDKGEKSILHVSQKVKSNPKVGDGSHHKFICTLIKTIDEWYYIEDINSRFFKCDEFESVLDYLDSKREDIKNILANFD